MTRRVGLGASLLVLLVAGVLRADTVILRDGRVITGRVSEQGDKYYIEVSSPSGRDLGGIAVPRQEVVRIETADGAARTSQTFDTVVLTDGRIVRGDARVSVDGSEVIVGLGDRGEVRHPRSVVSMIQWRDGRAEAATPEEDPHSRRLNETIDRRVRELLHGTDGEKLEARRELLALGTFSRAYVNALAEKHRPHLDPILADLDRLESLRKVLPSRAEEAIPRIAERLVAKDARDREAAVRSVVMEVPDVVGPLLLHLIKTDEEPRIRAYCVSQLAALRRFEELADVLKLGDGQLRLAAALALGDADIYAGVPILIEALRLPDLQIRTVAIERLTHYFGEHRGYRPQAGPEERERAVARWNAWWNENGAQIVRQSVRAEDPGAQASLVSPEERQRAQDLWAEATRLMAGSMQASGRRPDPAGGQPGASAPADAALLDDPERARQHRQNLERASDLLRQALTFDPALSSVRMTRAVLLYEELERPRDAERELQRVIARAPFDSAQNPDAAKKFANFHLGRIALREGSWEKATVKFSQALSYDPAFQDAILALGDTHFGLATAAPDAGGPEKVEGRRAALQEARKAYVEALKAIEREEAELRAVTTDLVADSPDDLAEGQVLQAVRKSLTDLRRRRAAVHFRVGRVCAALQDDQGTLEAYRTAYNLEPRNELYRQALEAWGERPAPLEERQGPPPSPAPPGGGSRAQVRDQVRQ